MIKGGCAGKVGNFAGPQPKQDSKVNTADPDKERRKDDGTHKCPSVRDRSGVNCGSNDHITFLFF